MALADHDIEGNLRRATEFADSAAPPNEIRGRYPGLSAIVDSDGTNSAMSRSCFRAIMPNQHQIDTPFQDIPHWFPVNPSCLHYHMGDFILFKPCGHILEFRRERAKTTLQLLQYTVLTNLHARRNALLVDV